MQMYVNKNMRNNANGHAGSTLRMNMIVLKFVPSDVFLSTCRCHEKAAIKYVNEIPFLSFADFSHMLPYLYSDWMGNGHWAITEFVFFSTKIEVFSSEVGFFRNLC